MRVAELRKRIEEYRRDLAARRDTNVVAGPNGPIGLTPIEYTMELLEVMEDRIEQLEARIEDMVQHTGAND